MENQRKNCVYYKGINMYVCFSVPLFLSLSLSLTYTHNVSLWFGVSLSLSLSWFVLCFGGFLFLLSLITFVKTGFLDSLISVLVFSLNLLGYPFPRIWIAPPQRCSANLTALVRRRMSHSLFWTYFYYGFPSPGWSWSGQDQTCETGL